MDSFGLPKIKLESKSIESTNELITPIAPSKPQQKVYRSSPKNKEV